MEKKKNEDTGTVTALFVYQQYILVLIKDSSPKNENSVINYSP